MDLNSKIKYSYLILSYLIYQKVVTVLCNTKWLLQGGSSQGL